MEPSNTADTGVLVRSVWPDWDGPVTKIEGDLVAGAPVTQLASHLRWLFTLGARYLYVDLTKVRLCDREGVRLLAAARRHAMCRGGWVSVTGSRALVSRLRELSDAPDVRDAAIAF